MAIFKEVNVFSESSPHGDKLNTKCDLYNKNMNWIVSIFNQNTATTFRQKGVDIGLTFALCHPANYNAIRTNSDSWHYANNNATITRIHSTTPFPASLKTCYPTTNRISSTLNHTSYNSISIEIHNVSCVICHTNPTEYAVFLCNGMP